MSHKGKGTAFLCALCLHSAALAFALQLRPAPPVAGDEGGSEMISVVLLDPGTSGSESPVTETPEIDSIPQLPKPELPVPNPSITPASAPVALSAPTARMLPVVSNNPGISRSGKPRTTGSSNGNGPKGLPYIAPQYRHHPPPPYPAEAIRARWEGLVLLSVELDEKGNPLSVVVSKSAGRDILDRAAVKAVKNWRFEAARLGGKTVAARVEVPVHFNL